MIYAFSDYMLNTERRELRDLNLTIKLEPKVYQVLVYLVEHRHRLVSKAELLDQFWAETYVNDNAVARCIRLLRRALGDSRHTQWIIQTQHRQGYRFIAAVTEQPEVETVAPVVTPPLSLSSEAPSPPLLMDHAERRQLTVLSCELQGLSPLPDQLEIEDYRDVIGAYQSTCAGVIAEFDGYIAHDQGEATVAYFGYPIAHEDDARRAVHTALEIVAALNPLSRRVAFDHGVKLTVQLGLHSGPVLVETDGGVRGTAPSVLGDTPQVALRIGQSAAPNTVVISRVTYALVQGYFDCLELSGQTAEDVHVSEPLRRVVRPTGAMSRLDTVGPMGLTTFVGRQGERALLFERWAQVCEGMGQVVLVRGEAGIGKSRLVQMLKAEIGTVDCAWLECQCSPYRQHRAWYPVIDLCQRLLHWNAEDTEAIQRQKLASALAPLNVPQAEAQSLLASLLSLSAFADDTLLHRLTPKQRRGKMLDMLASLVLALTDRQPVVLIVEDLHWVDPSMLELLRSLVEYAPTVRLYLVLTCRPTFEAPWAFRSYRTEIMLTRLSQLEVQQMVETLAGGNRLPVDLLHHVMSHSDGVPLYVEELTKAMLERVELQAAADPGDVSPAQATTAIPATLYESLMMRLDGLGTAKAVAQFGAVMGRRFSSDVLHATAPWEVNELQAGLDQLVEAELLHADGLPSQRSYVFKHALIRDAAYQSLVRETQQDYHERIAKTLATQFSALIETQPELLAHHYTEAGLTEQAIIYWQRAGQQALQDSANQEAIGHLTKELELMTTLPDIPERA